MPESETERDSESERASRTQTLEPRSLAPGIGKAVERVRVVVFVPGKRTPRSGSVFGDTPGPEMPTDRRAGVPELGVLLAGHPELEHDIARPPAQPCCPRRPSARR